MDTDTKDSDPDNTFTDITIGDVIDGFHIDTLLHEGDMSVLYHVSHPEHDLPMVMKVPTLGPLSPPASIASFETETRIMQKIHGASFPALIAVGDITRSPYLVMEYIEGADLQQAVEQSPVDIETLQSVAVPVCKAIQELHRRNVIHLDLKPSNVRNRADGSAVLLDFGIAHHALIPDMLDTGHGYGAGTVAYIAPEQVYHVREESRSDIFALGVILYQLATGKLPFGRANLLSLKKRLHETPIPPRYHNPDVPAWLQEIILRCLELHPKDRYPTAKQVGYLLKHPKAVELTELAHRTERPGILLRLQQWRKTLGIKPLSEDIADMKPHERIATAPHILVAVDLGHSSEELRQSMRNVLQRVARSEPHSFFTFLAVVVDAELPRTDQIGKYEHSPFAMRQLEMRNCMQSLRISKGRMNYQVVQAHDPATAIVEYARGHFVDQIIMCARGSSALRRLIGSVSAKVVAEAPCTVTVVRSRRDPGGFH